MIGNQFMNQQEEEFYREKAFLSAEKAEEERNLWQWIDENESIVNIDIVKDTPIIGNKTYLYNQTNKENGNQQYTENILQF